MSKKWIPCDEKMPENEAKIYVPDADFAPEKDNLEGMFSKLLLNDGMHVKSLSVENYKVDGKPKRDEDKK